jgi:hypothetical protein
MRISVKSITVILMMMIMMIELLTMKEDVLGLCGCLALTNKGQILADELEGGGDAGGAQPLDTYAPDTGYLVKVTFERGSKESCHSVWVELASARVEVSLMMLRHRFTLL